MNDDAPRLHLIELNLSEVDQLFNTMDPSPFHEKDLDRDAEEFITGWAHEHPRHARIALRVHLARMPDADPQPLIRDAVHNYFANRARMADLEFRRLMRRGRMSLTIGLTFLAACVLAAELVGSPTTGVARYLRESLTIAGWVAMWRPMQIYLYDWWPLREQRSLYARLSTMPVDVVQRVVPARADHASRGGGP